MFHNLDRKAINMVISEMSYFDIPAGTEIYAQGTLGSYYFVIDSGEVDLVTGTSVVKSLERKEDFGEMALIHTDKRRASAIAKTECGLWGISRDQFKQISK